jgi:hypothetical protein
LGLAPGCRARAQESLLAHVNSAIVVRSRQESLWSRHHSRMRIVESLTSVGSACGACPGKTKGRGVRSGRGTRVLSHSSYPFSQSAPVQPGAAHDNVKPFFSLTTCRDIKRSNTLCRDSPNSRCQSAIERNIEGTLTTPAKSHTIWISPCFERWRQEMSWCVSTESRLAA